MIGLGTLLSIVVFLLEGLFVIGVLGSVAVLAVTMVEDVRVILDKEDDAPVPVR